MEKRKHVHVEEFEVVPDVLFAILHRPSAIRSWWGAARAIVMPETGGIWSAAWGADEDDPDYVTSARIETFDPPFRLVLDDYRYYTKSGPLPFEALFVTEFLVTPIGAASLLRVTQSGFPEGAEADAFLAECEVGWRDTFAGIRRYLEG